MPSPKKSESLDESAWIRAALDLLVGGSVDSVGVEPLAKQLGVTKGSFYWHFKDRAALLQAMLRSWQQHATLSIIERLEQGQKTPSDRLRMLLDLPHFTPKGRRGALIELAIRAWARKDPVAAAAVAEVDAQRLKYLETLFTAKGQKREESRASAFLMYAFQSAECLINTAESETEKRKLRALCVDRLVGKP